tara:strand:+ start:5219 stop:5833 length:615 start_codon:yes stop_codon:yes gene_type:complete
MKVCILLSGRFYNLQNQSINIIENIKKNNKTSSFDVFAHLWNTEYITTASFKNDISALVSYFKFSKYKVENYKEVFKQHPVTTLTIMNYQRLTTFNISNDYYDVYIIIRPDINIFKLDLSKYDYIDNTVYAYRCPSHATSVCFDFADWVMFGNYATINKIVNINYVIDHTKSNEFNLKQNILNNDIKIVTIGTVGIELDNNFQK